MSYKNKTIFAKLTRVSNNVTSENTVITFYEYIGELFIEFIEDRPKLRELE